MPKTPTLSLDTFLAANSVHTASCSLAAFISTLSKANAAVVRSVIRDPRVQTTAVIRVLRPLGYTKGHQVIARHRLRGCATCGIEV